MCNVKKEYLFIKSLRVLPLQSFVESLSWNLQTQNIRHLVPDFRLQFLRTTNCATFPAARPVDTQEDLRWLKLVVYMELFNGYSKIRTSQKLSVSVREVRSTEETGAPKDCLKRTETQRPLSSDCTPSGVKFADWIGLILILPDGTVIICRNSNLFPGHIYIVICQRGR